MTDFRTALEEAFDEQTKETSPASGNEEEGRPAEDTKESVRTTETPEGSSAPAADKVKPEGDDKPVSEGDAKVAAERTRDPTTGKFVKGGNEQPKGDAPVPPERTEVPPAEVSSLKAPTSWKLGAREHWAKLPRPVQEEVNRRELEIQQELTRTGQSRKFAEDFYRVVGPYTGMIQAKGGTPLQAVDNLMRTAAGLTIGTAAQKAQIITNIIKEYGVDVKVLDEVLSGAGVSSEENRLAALIDQRLKPVNDFMSGVQRVRTSQSTELEQEVALDIQNFSQDPANEFYNDVKLVMADLMDAAHARGVKMDLKQAYARACELDPEVSAIVKQRKDAADATKAAADAAAIAKSKAASSSVRGVPKTKGDGTPMNRREAIASAWDDATSQ